MAVPATNKDFENALLGAEGANSRIWPPTLAIEVALKIDNIQTICENNQVTFEEWQRIKANPAFLVELATAMDALKKEGGSFKLRAGIMASDFLEEAFKMVKQKNDEITPSMRADMIKTVVRWAGWDNPAAKDSAQSGIPPLRINIVLNGEE